MLSVLQTGQSRSEFSRTFQPSAPKCVKDTPRSLLASLSRVVLSDTFEIMMNVYFVNSELIAIHGNKFIHIHHYNLSWRDRAVDDSEASRSAQTSVVPEF